MNCMTIDWSGEPLDLGDIPAGQGRVLNISLTHDADALVAWLIEHQAQLGAGVLNLRLTPQSGITDLAQNVQAYATSNDLELRVDLVIPDSIDIPAWYTRRDETVGALVEATQALSAISVPTRWLIALTNRLIYRVETISGLAISLGAEPVLVPQDMLRDAPAALEPDDHLFVWDFLTYSILTDRAVHFGRSQLETYTTLRDLSLEAAKGAITSLPEAECYMLDASGLRGKPCAGGALGASLLAGLTGEGTGQTALAKVRAAIEDLVEVGGIGLSGHIKGRLTKRVGEADAHQEMPYVVLIGAYGGEHIGDAAILGGVLERIHAQHGTKRAILMTQRPTHTRHLMPMLEVPVELEVWDYTYSNIAKAVPLVDGAVYAGGPLTDIPKHLVRHLETAARMKRAGKPFVMEGIGPHWFPRFGSRVTARRLVELADRITIRVKDDARYDVVKDIDFEIGHDPAFDYLKTRAADLTRLAQKDIPQLETLLEETKGRPMVGINIRPIGHLYAEPPAGMSKQEFTAQVVDKFEREFAQGIADYAAQSKERPCFIFFPMNAIQFGSSDLKSAWRIMRHLGPDIDFRLWEADASLDGVLYLLRKLDTVIAMRFHAAIFALSQGKDVIGIDYVIGKRDKVAAVLTDAGFPENVTRIDQLDASWLSEKLTSLMPKD